MSSWTITQPVGLAPHAIHRPDLPRKRRSESLAFGLVWLLAFAIPWGDMVQLPYDIQASRVFTLVAALVWVAMLWRKRKMRSLEPAHWWMILFILWVSVMALNAQEPERNLRRTMSYCQLFLDAWLIHQCASTWERYRKILFAFVLGCFVAFGGEAVNFLRDVATGDGRYTAPGFDPNDLAVTLVLGIPVAWNLSLGKERFRWVCRLYVACAVAGCLLTASRGALLTLGVALMFPLLSLRRSSIRVLSSAVVMFGVSGLVIFALWSDVWARRLSTISEQLSARDLNGRVDIWQRGYDAFLAHPLLGVGAGSFGTAVGGRRGGDLAAHNTLLGVLVENGLVGLTFFSGIVLCLWRRAWRLAKGESLAWIFLLMAWSVAVMSLSWENREMTWLLWGLCLASPMPLVIRGRVFSAGGVYAR